MAVILDSQTNTFLMRRKDSGVIVFSFGSDMTGKIVTFSVKESPDDFDEDAIIYKSYECGVDEYFSPKSAIFVIKPTDTKDVEIKPNRGLTNCKELYWGISSYPKSNPRLKQQIIPNYRCQYPKFKLYTGAVPFVDTDNSNQTAHFSLQADNEG